jgi:hypothetical protein
LPVSGKRARRLDWKPGLDFIVGLSFTAVEITGRAMS